MTATTTPVPARPASARISSRSPDEQSSCVRTSKVPLTVSINVVEAALSSHSRGHRPPASYCSSNSPPLGFRTLHNQQDLVGSNLVDFMPEQSRVGTICVSARRRPRPSRARLTGVRPSGHCAPRSDHSAPADASARQSRVTDVSRRRHFPRRYTIPRGGCRMARARAPRRPPTSFALPRAGCLISPEHVPQRQHRYLFARPVSSPSTPTAREIPFLDDDFAARPAPLPS